MGLAPPESYLDVTTSAFDLSLTWPYATGPSTFLYHGHNAYAYLLARYGVAAGVTTFDLIMIQFYEVTALGQPISTYLVNIALAYYAGWSVNFGSSGAVQWGSQRVSVPPAQFVIGLPNGWADGKITVVGSADAALAYSQLTARARGARACVRT